MKPSAACRGRVASISPAQRGFAVGQPIARADRGSLGQASLVVIVRSNTAGVPPPLRGRRWCGAGVPAARESSFGEIDAGSRASQQDEPPATRINFTRCRTLSVLIWASAMIRVLKGFAYTMRSEGTSTSRILKANASSYPFRSRPGIQAIVARRAEILRAGVLDAASLQVARASNTQ